MNVEEARIPIVDADWSIEIFLFSNGQQFSPPRKYYLRADELNSWEEALNHLAKSHYGLECPKISLFTTYGQLVEGPLELQGGHAYVAVADSDRFVNAGYQKYLIKASRSWEKRQARKKVAECIPDGDDPCYICPEKEWCCDPETCCVCPEIEDSYSQYPVSPASGLVGLRPAGGHYMSSAPTKPVATNANDGLRSGRIGPTIAEHEVRSADYGASPAEYLDHSHVPAQAEPDQYKAGLSVNEVNLAEEAPKLDENRPGPGEYRARSNESGTKLDENTGRPDEYEANLSDRVARFNNSRAEPGEYGPKLNDHGSRFSQSGERLVEYVARLSKESVKPGAFGARPGENVPRPADYETTPSRIGARSDESGAKSGEYGARLGENLSRSTDDNTKPTQNGARPDESGAKSSEYGARLGENVPRPTDYETRPSQNEARSDEIGAKPGEYGAIPGENMPRPTDYNTRPNRNGARPDERGGKPSEYGARAGRNVPRTADYETRLSRNGARPDESRAKPGKYGSRPGENVPRPADYDTRPNRNGARPDESGAKPSEYGAGPGENMPRPTDYDTRPNQNRARSDESGAKPGEYGSRLDENVAKPDDDETKPSRNGIRFDEYGAKPGAYKPKPIGNRATQNKPSVNRAKSGEYETKPNRNEARPGAKQSENKSRPNVNRTRPNENVPRAREYEPRSNAHGVKPSEHETKPSLNTAEPGEYATKAAEYAARPTENETTPSVNGVTPDEQEARPIEHVNRAEPGEQVVKPNECETRPSVNGIRPGQHEARPGKHVTRPIINRAKPGDSGAGPGKNEVWSVKNVARPIVYDSRAENEHTRRISGLRGGETQQGGKTGEWSREFGSKVSEQKGRETNPHGSAGAQRARYNGARLSAQRNKQSDILPSLGSRESKLGDHRARPADHGLKNIDHDTSLGNSVNKITDLSMKKAAPESKPNDRDRMNSEVRISALGQPKSRTPSRVDETAAKLDDSGIKNTVGYPGARPGSAGGTAAAGAPQISEAQQHARRSSLFSEGPSTDKKRFSIGQNSTLLKKPTPILSVLRELEDKQQIKSKQDILFQKTNETVSVVPVPAFNEVVKTKTLPECTPNKRSPSELPLPTVTSLESLTTNKAPLENIITDIPIRPTPLFHIKDPESEITSSMRLDSVKQAYPINNSTEETQTEMIYVGKSTASVSINVEVQTSTEALDTKQLAQEESASNKGNVDSRTCCLCGQKDHKLATVDPDENTTPILYKGDGGTINLKLDIKIRNIVKSVYSCQKNCKGTRSLTNIMTSEKESQISIEDYFFVRDSLHSLFSNKYSRYGFEYSPKVMVVQCAGCGRLNNPPGCDPSQCCENNKKYFVLLTNSVNEDMDENCNSDPACHADDLRQSLCKRQSSTNPAKKSYSNMIFDTITTVTVSGIPLPNREMKMCNIKNSSCQTDETYECKITKQTKVIITENTVTTPTSEKKSVSSISLATQAVSLTAKGSRLNMFQEICPELKEHEGSPVCSQTDQVPCQKVPSACSKVSSLTCSKGSMGCQQTCPPVQTQERLPEFTIAESGHPASACIQIHTHVCPHGAQVSDKETQTQWRSVILQARLHGDGRYSFHLPPLNVLNHLQFCNN